MKILSLFFEPRWGRSRKLTGAICCTCVTFSDEEPIDLTEKADSEEGNKVEGEIDDNDAEPLEEVCKSTNSDTIFT